MSGTALPSPRDDLGALEGYHSPQLDVAVRLNTNESPYPPPDAFVDAWLKALRAVPLHRYPDRSAAGLRTELGRRFGHPAGRVFCANGSNEVLQTLLLSYGGAGRRGLVFEPTYALHSHIARITGTEVVTGERTSTFEVSPSEAGVLISAERPTVVFLCNPNNPTGTVERRATVEAMLATCVEHAALLVVDEAYGEFADWGAAELVADDLPLVVVRTYSKVWSLAALRLGFCLAPTRVVEQLDKVVLPYHLSAATQLAGQIAFEFDDAMSERVAALVRERERLESRMMRLGGVKVFASGANFVLFQPAVDGHTVWQRLVEHGVLVRDFARWPRLEGCLRVSVGTPEENDLFLAALAMALEEVAA